MKTILTAVDVLVVSKTAIVREAMKRILQDHFVTVHAALPDHAEIRDGSIFGTGARQQLIIVDAASVEEGIESSGRLRGVFPGARLVMIADQYDVPTIARSFAAGIDGYLGKGIPCDTLIGALQFVILGEKFVPSQTVMALTEPAGRPGPVDWDHRRLGVNLSDREVEILQRLVNGEANKLISRRLMVTEATVKVHVKAILRKLRVLNRTQAAIWAVNQGLGSQALGADDDLHIRVDALPVLAWSGDERRSPPAPPRRPLRLLSSDVGNPPAARLNHGDGCA